MKIEIINESHHPLPQYATPLSAGMDLRANLDAPVTLRPLERKLIPTGLRIALPEGYEAQVRPRSGLALKKGVTVLNTPGTVDADYRGEVGVILINLSQEDFVVEDGEQVSIDTALEKGEITVEFIASEGEQNIDELPELDGDATYTAYLSGTNSQAVSFGAGSFMIKPTVTDKATGTVTITVQPAK